MKSPINLPVLALVLHAFIIRGQSNYIPQNNLKAWWPFDAQSNANSTVASVYNGTLYPVSNPPTLSNNRFGNINSAYSFNGGNWIETSCSGVLGDSARAVSFWAKTPGNNGNGMYILGWGGNFTGDRFGCLLDYPSGQLAAGGGNCLQPYGSLTNVADNNWHHYVYQFDPANGNTFSSVKVWQDAVSLFTISTSAYNPATSLYTTNGFNITFGKIIYPPAPEFYTGLLDETGLWQRTLSQCEISDLYYADTSIGTMSFNVAGYSGSVNNLAQYTRTLSGNTQFSVPIVAGVYSGTGVSQSGGQFHFNSPPTLPAGTYTITHTYTLQGGCVRTTTQTILLRDSKTGLESLSSGDQTDVSIFPNPASDRLFITSRHGMWQVNLSDATGKAVLSHTFFGQDEINLSPVNPGLYFISLKNEQGILLSRKIIILPH